MKRIMLLSVFAVISTLCCAQSKSDFLWPVEGMKAGTDILSSPQQYIGDELNVEHLIIRASEGSIVVAPADAVIMSVLILYNYSLSNSVSVSLCDSDYTKSIAELAESIGKNEDPKYINFSIGMRLADGRMMYLSGLSSLAAKFKTGEKIRKGQKLGLSGYSYKKIKEPSICISISDGHTHADDPMTPFGIQTTFIPPQAEKRKSVLSAAEARQDFAIFVDAVKDAYPSLNDIISEDELDRFITEISAKLSDSIKLYDFNLLMRGVVSRIHDSHISFFANMRPGPNESIWLPQIYFGWIGGRMAATMSTKEYADYFGRTIVTVDGIPADSIMRKCAALIGNYDAKVRSVVDENLALMGANAYSAFKGNSSMTLEFDNGEKLDLKGWKYRGGDPGFAHSWMDFLRTNYYPNANYQLREIDDSTAYIGLSTFALTEVETDDIVDFVSKQSAKPNMIVDVRNNSGGDVNVLKRLLSCFLNVPSREKGGYSMVYKRGGFSSFSNSLNYCGVDSIFTEYVPIEGKEGFYDMTDAEPVIPDSVVNYKGRLYVLTDAGSCSAATLFPASILRNHRGVIVGRETATAYHYMTALKFAQYRLPNSGFTTIIPLVKCVFDTTENERIPYGRGVIPDYEVDLSLDEIFGQKGDSILKYTLSLIDKGVYLGEDPFIANDTPSDEKPHGWIYTIAGLFLAAVSAMALVRRKK